MTAINIQKLMRIVFKILMMPLILFTVRLTYLAVDAIQSDSPKAYAAMKVGSSTQTNEGSLEEQASKGYLEMENFWEDGKSYWSEGVWRIFIMSDRAKLAFHDLDGFVSNKATVRLCDAKVKAWKIGNKKIARIKTYGNTCVIYKSKKLKGNTKLTCIDTNGRKYTRKVVVRPGPKGRLSAKKISISTLETAKVKLLGAKMTKRGWDLDAFSSQLVVLNWGRTKNGAVRGKSVEVVPLFKMDGKASSALLEGSGDISCEDTKGYVYYCKVNVAPPKITCKMEGTDSVPFALDDKWYYKRFSITNSTRMNVTFDEGAILYYPSGSINGSSIILPAVSSFGLNSDKYINEDNPLTVPRRKTATFWGSEAGTESIITGYGAFAMHLKIDGVEYACQFGTKGDLQILTKAK